MAAAPPSATDCTAKITVEPATIVFNGLSPRCSTHPPLVGNFSEMQKSTLGIKSLANSTQRLTYKMKSTRPKRFVIKPAYGYIEPNASAFTFVNVDCRPFNPAKGFSTHDRVTSELQR